MSNLRSVLTHDIPNLRTTSRQNIVDRNATVFAKYVCADGGTDWFVVEWDKHDDCFGFIRRGKTVKPGYFNLIELENGVGFFNFPVTVDEDWHPVNLSDWLSAD